MITQPFNFAAQLRRPTTALDFIPFVDACLILLFFSLLGSRFVLPPGMGFELPTTQLAAGVAAAPNRVLTVSEVEGGETLFFEGRILTVASLEGYFKERSGSYDGETLLVRIDRDVSFALSARVLEIAQAAGFTGVLVATKQEAAVSAERREP